MKKIIFTFVLSFSFWPTNAADIVLSGATYNWSCGYYSSTDGSFSISFKDEYLPWGTQVILHYGWGGYSYSATVNKYTPYYWNSAKSKALEAIDQFVWGTEFIERVASRGAYQHRFLDLAIEVIYPEGERYRYPSRDLRKFYHMDISDLSLGCVQGAAPKERKKMLLTPIEID